MDQLRPVDTGDEQYYERDEEKEPWVWMKDAVNAFRRDLWTRNVDHLPIESLLKTLAPGTKVGRIWPLAAGGYEAVIGVPIVEATDEDGEPQGFYEHEEYFGEGPTIEAAIRSAANEAFIARNT